MKTVTITLEFDYECEKHFRASRIFTRFIIPILNLSQCLSFEIKEVEI